MDAQNNDEITDQKRVFNNLLVLLIEYSIENRGYFLTIIDELARQNSITNESNFDDEKTKLYAAYPANFDGGHVRFGKKIMEKFPELSDMVDENIKRILELR